MKITTDTNLLVRLFVEDDDAQTDAARALLHEAELVVIPIAALCEFVWVLRATYRQPRHIILGAIENLLEIGGVTVDRGVAEAGLAMMRAGGDFTDGAMAEDGRFRGGTVFTSFDRRAVERLSRLGVESRLVDASA